MKYLYTFLLTCLISLYSFAQPTVMACVEINGGDLEVKVQPNSGFSGLIANIQLTIKAADPTVTFGGPTDILAYIPMAKAGGTTVDGGAAYQKFAGFGSLAMSAFGESWAAGEIITLFTITPSSVATTYEIATDQWASDNNGEYYVELEAQDRSGAIASCIGLLPVEGMELAAKKVAGQGIILQWETLAEVNTDYFVIEKSLDGKIFTQLGRIDAAGFSDRPRAYSYIDASYEGLEQFYRVKQIDIDGSFSFSNMVRVLGEVGAIGNFYPNPAESFTQLAYVATHAGIIQLRFLNTLGQYVYESDFPVRSGNNVLEVSTAHLGKGLYQVQFINKGSMLLSRSLVIQ